jgi:hypothetical protein
MQFDFLLFSAMASALVQVAGFWWMCWSRGVMGAFGRQSLSWSSLGHMTAAAFVPLAFLLGVLSLDLEAPDEASEMMGFVLLAALNWAGVECTQWLGRRVVLEVAA